MKKFNESYNKILKEGLLNRTGARMSGIGGYFKNLGNAIVGKQSDNSYKQAKINSIAASSAKEMLNDFYKLGLIPQPTEDQIKNIAASISGALTGSTPAATTPAATTPTATTPTATTPAATTPAATTPAATTPAAVTSATDTSVATTPDSSKSMSDEDWENNFKARGGTPDLPETTTTTAPSTTAQQPLHIELTPEEEAEIERMVKNPDLIMSKDQALERLYKIMNTPGMTKDIAIANLGNPVFEAQQSLSNFNNLYRNLIG